MPSPILQQTTAQPLSLDLLREHVPVVQDGYQALLVLQGAEAASLSVHERRALLVRRNRSKRSQELLLWSALPLIRKLASNELSRRSAWKTRISYDDLYSEAMVGFVKGLLAYDVERVKSSPTNYLGQWITSGMRRSIEELDHDFAVPFEVIERARKIRAVQSRMTSEKGIEPTDEELLERLNSGDGFANGYKWGRKQVAAANAPKVGAKRITQKQLDEARELLNRSYALTSLDASASGEDEQESYDRAGTPLTMAEDSAQDSVVVEDLARSRRDFFNAAFTAMRLGSRQRDVIARFFGLSPYTQPQAQKDIGSDTGYSAKFVKDVIVNFSSYMPVKGGVFHRLLLNTPAEVIEALELSWLLPQVGDWPEGQREPIKVPDVLTKSA